LLLLAGLVEMAFGSSGGQLRGLVFTIESESWEDVDMWDSMGVSPEYRGTQRKPATNRLGLVSR
jgi:hypothetical protein